MQIKSATIEMDHINAVTEFETLKLITIGTDGHGNYAVKWDAGDKWECGQFVDIEDAPELYTVSDEDKYFQCEDGTTLVSVKNQDGGFSWKVSE